MKDNNESFKLVEKAFLGNCGADQAVIANEVIEWGALLIKKNTDYGSSVWKKPELAPDCEWSTAIRVRMSDKISRIKHLLVNGATLESESLEDSILDLGAYCLLLIAGKKNTEHQSVN